VAHDWIIWEEPGGIQCGLSPAPDPPPDVHGAVVVERFTTNSFAEAAHRYYAWVSNRPPVGDDPPAPIP